MEKQEVILELKNIATGAWAVLSSWLVVNTTLVSTFLGIITLIVVVTFHILNYALNRKRTKEYLIDNLEDLVNDEIERRQLKTQKSKPKFED